MTTDTDTPNFGEHTEAVMAYVQQQKEAEVAGLKAKNAELLDKVSKTKGVDIDVEEYLSLKEAKRLDEENREKAKGNYEALIQRRDAEAAEKIKAAEDKVNKYIQRLQKSTFDTIALDAINTEQGISKLLLPIVERRTRTTIDEDGNTKIEVLDEDGVPAEGKTMRDLLNELKADPEYGNAFRSTAASGGGASTGAKVTTNGVVNPYKPESFNMTEIGIMERDNPALAAKMKAAAGQ